MPKTATETADFSGPEADDAGSSDATRDQAWRDRVWADERRSDTAVPDHVLTFRLGAQLYALPIEAVEEIQQIVEFAPLPNPSSGLAGFVDRRGDVIPVIELRSLLGLSAHEHTLETPLMFCRVGARDVCLVVDAVDDVLEVPAGALMPPSELLDASNCMLGSLRHPDGLVLVLDIERLLSALPLKASAPSGGERL